MTPRSTIARGPADWDWTAVSNLCLRETRRVVGSRVVAEDAAQEAAVRAWRQRHTCRTPDRPAPWIASIARREALRAVAGRREEPLEAELEDRGAVDAERRVLERLDLERVLSMLDRSDRRLLLGRYWQDRTYHDLAVELGVPEVTIRVRLHRLRLRLRTALAES